MRVVGFRNADFVGKDGRSVSGVSVFVSRPITQGGGGEAVEKVFLNRRLLDEFNYRPEVGDEIELLYDRFAKVKEIRFG